MLKTAWHEATKSKGHQPWRVRNPEVKLGIAKLLRQPVSIETIGYKDAVIKGGFQVDNSSTLDI